MTRMTDSKTKRLYIRKPSFSASGAYSVMVGKTNFSVDRTWPVHHEMGGELCWVMLPSAGGRGDIRLLSEKGEIAGVPAEILDLARHQFFDN
jgi:hypothetical protein